MKKAISDNRYNILHKYIIIAVAIAIFLTGAAGVSYAMLKAKTQTVVNNFNSAAVNIGIVESDSDNKEVIYEDMDIDERGRYNNNADNINNAYYKIKQSGDTQQKSVSIKNITSKEYPTTDTYVRVRLIPSVVYDYSEENIAAKIAGQTVCVDMKDKVEYIYSSEGDNWEFESVTDNDNDGYYYYKNVLNPGQTTDKLIEGVTYTGQIPDNAHFELMVLAQAVSAAQYEEFIQH